MPARLDDETHEQGVLPRLSYYADHREEIDEWIRANQEESASAESAWRRQQALARE